MITLEEAVRWAFGAPGRIQQNEWEMRTFLCKAIDDLAPERTVELGSWRGVTAALLSHVTSVYTISLDIQDYGGKQEALEIAGTSPLLFTLLDARKSTTVTEVSRLMRNKPIDLLFLDDGHRIEEVTEEHALWAPLVRPGGWIVFHDINPAANQCAPGVHPDICQAHAYWSGLKGDKEEIVFGGKPPGPGIGILRV